MIMTLMNTGFLHILASLLIYKHTEFNFQFQFDWNISFEISLYMTEWLEITDLFNYNWSADHFNAKKM